MCKVFSTSLKGPALCWFTRLPLGSMDSFTTLSSRFVIQFATSRPHQLTPSGGNAPPHHGTEARALCKQPINEEQVTYLSSQLSEVEARDIKQILVKYSDLFAWTAADMPGIDPSFHCHRLSVYTHVSTGRAAFITKSANFCYRVMPVGLKNAGATYQRLMDKSFHQQIEKCLEVYVDDMVVKSDSMDDHIKDLRQVFDEAIIDMRSPRNVKEVQRLAGRIASLARFLPCMADKSRPIMSLLKKARKFQWIEECELSFQEFKEMLAAPPLLSKQNHQSDLIVYIVVSKKPISVALVQERKEQVPVYFVSRVLQEAENRYQQLEKTVLALVQAARRLHHYFQSHKIVVRTNNPIVKVLRKPELAGKMVAWSIEPLQFDIQFESKGPIKAQSMADLLNEFHPETASEKAVWTLHVNGSSNQQGSGAGIILKGLDNMVVEQSLCFNFKTSNNQSEYEALLAGLRLARELGITRVKFWSDSQVVTEQINGTFEVKELTLLKYFHAFQKLKATFEEVHISHTLRELNTRAGQLAKLESSKKTNQLRSAIHQELQSPSIVESECLEIRQGDKNWMTNITNYLLTGNIGRPPQKL
uniref:Retrovirus-related Pol polyprotein from transposon 17.6 n=1 Tax=Cajanus cajan TaxID=3821 RepID=A0A151RLL2_CAJCA|nr:Retrovirus-related Pol polyprotein from transposon 17.6 [Cajanus cajan]